MGQDFMQRVEVPSQTSGGAFTDAEGKSTALYTERPDVADVHDAEEDAKLGCECEFLHGPEGCGQQPTLLENGGQYAVCTRCDKRTCWACSVTNALSVNHPDKSRRHLRCPV